MPRVRKYSSKSDFIRQFLSEHPEASDAEIISAGNRAKQNITKFAINYIRYARPSLNEPSTYAPSEEPETIEQVIDTGLDLTTENPFADLRQTKVWKSMQKDIESVRKFCEKHGGIHKVKTIIENMETYEQLQKLLS